MSTNNGFRTPVIALTKEDLERNIVDTFSVRIKSQFEDKRQFPKHTLLTLGPCDNVKQFLQMLSIAPNVVNGLSNLKNNRLPGGVYH